MTTGEEPADVNAGAIEPGIEVEFPGLILRWCALRARTGASPAGLRARLRELSDRARGGRVVAMRTQPVAHAFRAFFRHTGLDPDVTRVPSEEVAVARLLQGGYRSAGRLHDALLIAVVETGVPVWALDAEVTEPATLMLRTSRAGEVFGAHATPLAAGRLVLADARRVHGLLFAPPVAPSAAGRRTRELVLVSVGVPGVPEIFVQEALWLCAETLQA